MSRLWEERAIITDFRESLLVLIVERLQCARAHGDDEAYQQRSGDNEAQSRALLPEAIGNTWPLAVVQTCVLHLIRNTFRFASKAEWNARARDLRPVYTAVSEHDAKERFTDLTHEWGDKYPAIIRLWENAWTEFVPFLDYSPEIRKVI